MHKALRVVLLMALLVRLRTTRARTISGLQAMGIANQIRFHTCLPLQRRAFAVLTRTLGIQRVQFSCGCCGLVERRLMLWSTLVCGLARFAFVVALLRVSALRIRKFP